MSWVATAVVGGAVIGAGATMYSSGKASSAASAQSAASIESTRMQIEFLEKQRGDILEAVNAGLIDLETGYNMAISEMEPMADMEAYNAAMELLRDPNAIMDRPSTQFQYNQGVEALQAALSRTSGGGISGPAMKAATEYGQNYASMALDAELARLSPFAESEIGARTNIANMMKEQGGAMANLRVGGVTGASNITGQMGQVMGTNATNLGNISAANSINQANLMTGFASNVAQTGTDLAMLYAMKPGLFSG